MKKLLCIVLVIFFSLGLANISLAVGIDADSEITGPIEEKVFSNATMDDDFADDQVIVIMTNSASLKFKEYTVVDFSEIPCNKVRDLMPTATAKAEAKEKGLDVVSLFRSADNAVVTSDFYDIDTSSFRQILCLTLSDPGKENVLAAIKALENRTDVYYAGPAYTVKLCSESSGELAYFNQTALNKVQLPQAWNMVTKSNTVYVGIVDTGIDNTHPDLYGIVDVTKSRSYANHSASALVDTDGHGTGVAGVVGMVTNEISGTSGNNWNIKLVSLKALNHPYENYTGIFDAINAADELGISILNISLVVEESDSILYDFIQAINNYSGLIVCGAGNDGRDLDNMTDSYNVYPPEYSTEHDNLITVGATTTSDQLASYSNHSDTFVNICAPGGILSCYPSALCGYTMHSDSHHDYGYHRVSGTSFAAPFVTGVAALMLVEDPTLAAAEIKETILEEADKLSNLTQYCEDGNRLNAYAAVAACHTHHFFYNKTATTHTGTCPCGATTGTMFHSWGTNLDGTRVCTICGYYRAAQIVSIPHYETE